MTEGKRRRGRPVGSGINDSEALKKVADLMVAEPTTRPTTAMKRCVYAVTESHLRRLQEKWSNQKVALLAEAQQRAKAKAQPRVTRTYQGGGGVDVYAHVQNILSSSLVREPNRLQDQVNLTMKAVHSYTTNEALLAQQRGLAAVPSIALEAQRAQELAMAAFQSPVVKALQEHDLLQKQLALADPYRKQRELMERLTLVVDPFSKKRW